MALHLVICSKLARHRMRHQVCAVLCTAASRFYRSRFALTRTTCACKAGNEIIKPDLRLWRIGCRAIIQWQYESNSQSTDCHNAFQTEDTTIRVCKIEISCINCCLGMVHKVKIPGHIC
jgi:hypothetical protein